MGQAGTTCSQGGDTSEDTSRQSPESSVQRGRHYPDILPPSCFYDIVLPCQLSHLCDDEESKKQGEPGFWVLHTFQGLAVSESRDLETWAGHVVGILGQYNRGKTWIMSRLSGCKFPNEGLTIRTEGISLKWIETKGHAQPDAEADTYWHLVIDTAGFNTPVTLSRVKKPEELRLKRREELEQVTTCAQAAAAPIETARHATVHEVISKRQRRRTEGEDEPEEEMSKLEEANKRMQETEQYEQFLQSLTLSLADYLIVVMHETTLSDQKFLFDVVRKWKDFSLSSANKCKEVFVLHNFKETNDAKERVELFKQCTEDILDGRAGQTRGVHFFSCPTLRTRHICLMNDRTNSSYNDKVFAVVKDWIHNILPPPDRPHNPRRLAEHFASCCSHLLSQRGFLENVKEISLEERDGQHVYTVVKRDPNNPVVRLASEEDKFYSSLHTFHPTYSIRHYRSESNTECKMIQVEAPGVSSIRAKQKWQLSKVGHWAVEVTGTKEKSDGVTLMRQQNAIANNTRLLPAAQPAVTSEPDADTCRYGKFSAIFQIHLKFQKPKITVIGPHLGVFYLLFEEEEDSSDEDEQMRK